LIRFLIRLYVDARAVDADTVNKAQQAVNLVLRSSELQGLWEETEEYEQWRAVVTELLGRLDSDP
jgi:hypothetical protein